MQLLRHIPDMGTQLIQRIIFNIDSAHTNRARNRAVQRTQQLSQGTLTRTGRTHESNIVALRHAQRDIRQHRFITTRIRKIHVLKVKVTVSNIGDRSRALLRFIALNIHDTRNRTVHSDNAHNAEHRRSDRRKQQRRNTLGRNSLTERERSIIHQRYRRQQQNQRTAQLHHGCGRPEHTLLQHHAAAHRRQRLHIGFAPGVIGGR